MAVRTWSSDTPLAASFTGSSSTRTAGSAPPLMDAWPTPSTCDSFCASTVDAASYICPRVSALDVSARRSEEHTSELQSQSNIVCRLLLEKKKYIECVVTVSN